jgi:hypothetical protein
MSTIGQEYPREPDWHSLDHVKGVSARQKELLRIVRKYRILEILEPLTPLIASTINLEIDTPSSDVDICLHCRDSAAYYALCRQHFSAAKSYTERSFESHGTSCFLVGFFLEDLEFELVAQNIPSPKQLCFVHMVIAWRILALADQCGTGGQLRTAIRGLKLAGVKTEPAIAQSLGLEGDPYLLLKDWHALSWEELACQLHGRPYFPTLGTLLKS